MYRGIVAIVLLVFPSTTDAAVRITEIMYDAPGTDAGREWFEIHNTEATPFDPTTILFFEAETNHKITYVRGAPTLAPEGYGVVVDDVEAFLGDFPTYAGALFDSSWSSFGNEGEVFELRDSEGMVLDRVQYSNAPGGMGDGSSLHGFGNSWQARAPSPGTGNTPTVAPVSSTPAQPLTPSQSNVVSSPSSGSTYTSSPASPQHAPKVNAGGNRTIFSQVATEFSAELTGVAAEAKPFASYRWNFGNGEEVLKRAVLYRYVRPGSYSVSVSVSTGGSTVSDRIVVTVIPTEVSILDVGSQGIEVYNGATKDVDLTDWKLQVGSSLFTFPKDTTLLAGKTLFFESRITTLVTDDDTRVDLLYPTGDVAVSTKSSVPEEPLEVITQKVVNESKESKPRVMPTAKDTESDVRGEVVDDTAVERSIEATSSSDTNQLAAAGAGLDTEGATILWHPVLALMALIGVASSAVFLMKSSKPVLTDNVSSPHDAVPPPSDPEVLSSKMLSRFTVVTKPISSGGDRGKTNEADSYTIVE